MHKKKTDFSGQVDFWNSVINPDNITVGQLNPEGFDLEKNLAFYLTPIQEYAYGLMGGLEGKRVLELGCGLGLNTVIMAREGAVITAIDIAEKRVNWVNNLAKKHGLKNINAICMSAENLEFAYGSFDIIYSNEVLIHTDKPKVLAGCDRLLKRGGKAVFIESLKFNPFINLYRNTLGPKIFKSIARHFDLEETGIFRDFFPYVKHKEFYFLAPMAFFWQFGVQNKELFRYTLRLLDGIDKFIFFNSSIFRRLAWMVCIECRK